MADDPKQNPSNEAPDDFSLDAGGGELALRAEMGAQEFLLRNGPYLVAAVGVMFVGFVVYGWWADLEVSAQRAATSRIADVERTLPSDLLQLAQAKAGMGTPPEPELLSKKAADMVAVGDEASGTAAVEAWLKAAELYRIAGDAGARRAALEKAAAQADGVLAYAAGAALANLDLEEGQTESGLKRFESLASSPDAFLARQATLDLAAAYDAVGQFDKARATYDRFLSTWPDAPGAEEAAAAKERVGQNKTAPPAPVAPAGEDEGGDPEPAGEGQGTEGEAGE